MTVEQRLLDEVIRKETNLTEKIRLLRLQLEFNAARAAIQNELLDRMAR